MNKVKLVVVAAVLAAPMTATAVDVAEARPRLSRIFRVAHTLRVFRPPQPRIYVYRQIVRPREHSLYQGSKQRREAATVTKKPAQRDQPPGAAGVKQVDGRGRVYDPAGMAWFDGVNKCWTGTQPWTFKNNAWYYGNARWYPSNGDWLSDTADPPAPVACHTIPAFAATTPPAQEIVRYDESDVPPVPRSETKSVQPSIVAPAADRPANCKKYLAIIGETVSMPCEPPVAAPRVEPDSEAPAAKPKLAPASVRVAEPAPPAHTLAAAPTAERAKEDVRVKAKRKASRDQDDD
jgi:hypothetical protein